MTNENNKPVIDEANLDKLIRSYNIPPQPHILSRIQEAGDDINKIADIISQDVSLSSG